MLGHISGAYAARVSRDLSLCSRYDFNVYSFESEWTMGAEWWIRSGLSKSPVTDQSVPTPPHTALTPANMEDDLNGVMKVRASTSNVS